MSLFSDDDVAAFYTDRVGPIAATYAAATPPTAAYAAQQLRAAEADIGRKLKVDLEPTIIFAYPPTEAETDPLDAAKTAWREESAYDYGDDFFSDDTWGYLVLRSRPVVSVDFMRLVYPNPASALLDIPRDWLRIDKQAGVIRLVPALLSYQTPLAAFILQAAGGGATVPAMIQLRYTAGIKDAATKWPDLVDVIQKAAVLRLLQGFYLPQSASISGDGLSESVSFDVQKHQDLITEALFGPKGCNGGLWTAIHGIGVTMGGVTA